MFFGIFVRIRLGFRSRTIDMVGLCLGEHHAPLFFLHPGIGARELWDPSFIIKSLAGANKPGDAPERRLFDDGWAPKPPGENLS